MPGQKLFREFFFPMSNRFVAPRQGDWRVLPQPVLAVQHLVACLCMALEAAFRHIRAGLVGAGHEQRVVRMRDRVGTLAQGSSVLAA